MQISSFDIQNRFLIYRLPSILMPKTIHQDVDKIFSLIFDQEIKGVFVDFSHVDTIITDGLTILNKILKGIILLGSECSISSMPSHLAQPLSDYLEKLPEIKVIQSFSDLIRETEKEKTDKEFFTPEILSKIYGKDKLSGQIFDQTSKSSDSFIKDNSLTSKPNLEVKSKSNDILKVITDFNTDSDKNRNFGFNLIKNPIQEIIKKENTSKKSEKQLSEPIIDEKMTSSSKEKSTISEREKEEKELKNAFEKYFEHKMLEKLDNNQEFTQYYTKKDKKLNLNSNRESELNKTFKYLPTK